MESTEQLWFMAGMATVLWTYLLVKWGRAWYRHTHPRRTTYTAPRAGRRALSVPITEALKK